MAAIRQIVASTVLALVAAVEDPAVQIGLSRLVRNTSKQAVLGVQEAFEAIDARHARGRAEETVLTRLQSFAERASVVFWVAVAAVGLIVALLIAFLLRARARARAAAARARHREAVVLALIEAMRTSDSHSWSPELLNALKDAFHEEPRPHH